MKNNWNKILNELSYRVSSGIPDLSNEQHLMKLWDILKEHNWNIDARVELLKNLDEMSIVKNKKSGNVYPVKKFKPQTQTIVKKDATKDDIKKAQQGAGEDEFDTPQASTGVDSVEIEPEIITKDKDLKTEVVAKTNEEFNEGKLSEDGVSDEDFDKNERVKALPNQISLEELEKSFPKPLPFPKKYLKVLQRLLNTDEGGVKISDFTDAAGGGTLASTGGEILTMMMTSIDDDNIASQLTERLTEHIKSNGNKKSIINTKWVESALKCRKSIRDRYDRMYGKGNWKLKNQAWDIKEEVEALGMVDYKNNKGFSTDVYFTIEVDGKTILDEVSLKQNKKANLLNGSTSRVYDILMRGNGTPEQVKRYDDLNYEKQALEESITKANKDELKERLGPAKAKEAIADIDNRIDNITGQLVELEDEVIPNKIPENLEIKVAQQKQDEGHKNNIKKNEKQLNDTIRNFDKMSAEEQDKLLDRVGSNKPPNLNQDSSTSFRNKQRTQMKKILDHINSGKSLSDLKLTKDMRKSLATVYLMTPEDSEARKGWEEIKDTSRQHSKDVAKYLFENEEAKQGLIKSIREDFPLQALLSGEESMALGDLSADKGTLKAIFGTDDFNKIQQNLTVVGDALVYTSGSGKQIPVSTIVSRPDGIGYGTSWKLEMQLHPEFAKELEKQRDTGK